MRWIRRLILLLVLAALAIGVYGLVLVGRTPDLGAAPGGANDGNDERSIALHLAAALAPLLVPGHAHQTVTLSEHDLGVLVAAHLPADGSLRDAEARVRGGRLVLSGITSFGPLDVIGVGRCTLRLVTGADGLPDVAVDVQEVDAGDLRLPSAVNSAITNRVRSAVDLRGVLGAVPFATPVRTLLDCVAVHADGLVLGFHQPGAGTDPGGCTG